MMRSIVLVGPRACGKTTVGKEVASKLNFPFIDADSEFTKRYGTIANYVSEHKWGEFRRMETELLTDICRRYQNIPTVLAPGGGAVAHNQGEEYRTRNGALLRDFGTVFYLLLYPDLKQTAQGLAERVEQDKVTASQRPSLTGKGNAADEMLTVLEQRHPFYVAAAHHTVYTADKTARENAQQIFDLYTKGA